MVDFIRAISKLLHPARMGRSSWIDHSQVEGCIYWPPCPPPPYAFTNGSDASYPQLKISCHISSHGKRGHPIKSTQKRTDSVLLSILKDSVLRCTTSYYIPPLVVTNGRCIYQTSVYLRTVNTLLWYSRTLTYLHLGGSKRCHLHITQIVWTWPFQQTFEAVAAFLKPHDSMVYHHLPHKKKKTKHVPI